MYNTPMSNFCDLHTFSLCSISGIIKIRIAVCDSLPTFKCFSFIFCYGFTFWWAATMASISSSTSTSRNAGSGKRKTESAKRELMSVPCPLVCFEKWLPGLPGLPVPNTPSRINFKRFARFSNFTFCISIWLWPGRIGGGWDEWQRKRPSTRPINWAKATHQ